MRFANPFVSGGHQRSIGWMLWGAIFLAGVLLAGAFAARQVRESVRQDLRTDLVQLNRLRTNIVSAFEALRRDVTAEPCSREFHEQMRRIAFLPDGLNEFMYASGGRVLCSTSTARFSVPILLGDPDVAPDARFGIALWINRDLDLIGLRGLKGTVALAEPFAIVIPPQTLETGAAQWIRKELALVTDDGRWWHAGGEFGVFGRRDATQATASSVPPHPLSTLREVACDRDDFYCVAAEATLSDVVSSWSQSIVISVASLALLSAWAAGFVRGKMLTYWSLEARFRRHLDAQSLTCAYQPILNIRTGSISGCEVLARWRDVDGSIVSPDKFIALVERAGRTLEFTRMLVEKAHRELVTHVPAGAKLQVNFNIFPCDLGNAALVDAFSVFAADRDRFEVAVEIVESDAVRMEVAQRVIEELGRAGIKTYIDDFGTGYSNMHNVAMLMVQGVKLDRSFAMAPNDSMMGRMLVHVLEMVHATGRAIVVEGVETQERLELLRKTKLVDFVQGYLIARPLAIDRFKAFLADDQAPQGVTVDQAA